MTGTAKQHVADDYNMRIAAGREEADAVVRQGLEAMLVPRCGPPLGDHRMGCLPDSTQRGDELSATHYSCHTRSRCLQYSWYVLSGNQPQ